MIHFLVYREKASRMNIKCKPLTDDVEVSGHPMDRMGSTTVLTVESEEETNANAPVVVYPSDDDLEIKSKHSEDKSLVDVEKEEPLGYENKAIVLSHEGVGKQNKKDESTKL